MPQRFSGKNIGCFFFHSHKVLSLQLNDAHGDVESEDDGDDDELLPLAQFCYHDPSGFS